MAKRLYMGNLPMSMTLDNLEQLVAAKGAILNIRLMTDPFSGKSRGFAFVEMRRDQDAQTAIQELNGLEIDGRTITVNEARPHPQEGRGSARGGFRRRSF